MALSHYIKLNSSKSRYSVCMIPLSFSYADVMPHKHIIHYVGCGVIRVSSKPWYSTFLTEGEPRFYYQRLTLKTVIRWGRKLQRNPSICIFSFAAVVVIRIIQRFYSDAIPVRALSMVWAALHPRYHQDWLAVSGGRWESKNRIERKEMLYYTDQVLWEHFQIKVTPPTIAMGLTYDCKLLDSRLNLALALSKVAYELSQKMHFSLILQQCRM